MENSANVTSALEVIDDQAGTGELTVNLSNLSFEKEDVNENGVKMSTTTAATIPCAGDGNKTIHGGAAADGTPAENKVSPTAPISENATDNKHCDAEILNAHSTSLGKLLVYGSGDSEDEDEDGEDDDDVRNADHDDEDDDDDTSSSSESDSFECVIDAPELNAVVQQAVPLKKKRMDLQDTLKQFGELSLDDLPPVPTPTAEVKAEQCEEIGKIASIIDKLVMVESIPNKPAYNIDSLLFLDKGQQPLGYVFDVIGPVTNPMYAIRFNSTQDIASQNIKVGMPVYSAPKTEHSQFVFVQQLLKEKGSDASWTKDCEVPAEFQDYSDDEAEFYLGVNADNRKRSSLDRHKDFEKDMNVRNLIDTRLHKVRDHCESKTRRMQEVAKQRATGGYVHQLPHHQQLRQLRPNFHQNTSPCAFHPPYSLPPYMPSLSPYVPQFVAGLPPPLPPLQFATPPPPPPPHMSQAQQQQQQPVDVASLFSNLPMVPPPPSGAQQASKAAPVATVQAPAMMYPPDMGLPSTTQNPSLVPNLPYYNPQVMWSGYGAQAVPQPRPAATGSQSDIRPHKKYYKMRRK